MSGVPEIPESAPFTAEQRQWLNGFLAAIKADGRYEDLRRKWFESTDWFDLYR